MNTKQLDMAKRYLLIRLNTDTLSGWETGLQGKQRIGRSLHERYAPEHLWQHPQRLEDWNYGRDAAYRYLASRETVFSGETADGKKIELTRKGWVARGPVISVMERRGVVGDVWVYYLGGGEVARSVMCGI